VRIIVIPFSRSIVIQPILPKRHRIAATDRISDIV
jgi:hypothetical protein